MDEGIYVYADKLIAEGSHARTSTAGPVSRGRVQTDKKGASSIVSSWGRYAAFCRKLRGALVAEREPVQEARAQTRPML